MLPYILILIFAIIYYQLEQDNDEQSKAKLGIFIAGLALFVGCSDMLGGYDRYIYGEVFDQIALWIKIGRNLEDTAGYELFNGEWGFLWFNRLMGYITLNRYIFILAITCLIYTLLYKSISQYCADYPFAVIFFLGLWFFFTFTYLRQVAAATIGWLSIKYIFDRKPFHFFALVVLAFGFHNSAIVLAPLYFIPQRKIPPSIVISGLALCLALGLSHVLGSFVAGSEMIIDDSRVGSNVSMITEGSFRVAYLIEAIFFISLIFWSYDIFDENDSKQMIMLNIGIMFCATLLLFVRSENGGRIAWFFMIGIISTFSYISAYSQTPFFRTGFIILCILLYLRILFAWGNQISPYKSFFTNGHRNDWAHNNFEYDPRYDEDKFYKW